MISKVTFCVVSSLLFSCALANGEVENPLELSKRCAADGSPNIPWANKFDEPVDFKCPNDGAITSIYSEYSECRRDRVWSFGCTDVVPSSFEISCKWSRDFVNDWDKPLVGFCEADSYLAGMYSVHDNSKEDRRFKTYCCKAVPKKKNKRYLRYITTECCPPAKFKSAQTYRDLIDFDVGEGHECSGDIVSGLQSTHDNGKEDRIWTVTVCKFTNGNCRA